MDNGKSFSLEISSGTMIRAILLVGAAFALYYLRDIVLVILTAVVIASSVEPAVVFFGKRKIGRLPAVILVYAALALVFAGLVYFFLVPLLHDLSLFLSTLPAYLDSLESWGRSGSGVVSGLSKSISLSEVVNDLAVRLSTFFGGFVSTASLLFGGVVSFVLMVVLSFYLAVQEDGVGKFLRIVTPLRYEKYVLSVWSRSQNKIARWMQGQFLLLVLIGVLVFLGLTILGIKQALILGVLAAVFELIPLFGPILASIPGIAIAFSTGGATGGLLAAGLYLIIHQFENHLFYPLVVKKVVGINPVVVILALVIGWELAGFLGIILSVPVATVMLEILGDLERGKAARLAEKETAKIG